MKVTELWRYPVKTMAGEKLERAELGPVGLEGDRLVHVEDSRGHVVTSRSHPHFLGHKGAYSKTGAITVDGRPWDSPEVAADVVAIAGKGAQLVRYEGVERFDVLPLLIATDGAIAAFGQRFEGKLALNCFVIEGGEISLGDEVQLVSGRWRPSRGARGLART